MEGKGRTLFDAILNDESSNVDGFDLTWKRKEEVSERRRGGDGREESSPIR